MLSAMPLFNNNAAFAQGYETYGDNSYYSQYPTDDKKYECRTGPFEGFFVGSVEFCKHVKFDKKMIVKETIEQELRVQLAHKVHQEQQEQQEQQVQQVHKAHLELIK
jgi:hypothetical protein